MRKRIAVVLAIGTLLACEDDPVRPPPAVYGGTSPDLGVGSGGGQPVSDGGTDAGDAGACTTLEVAGNLVDQQGIVGDPPAGSGGTVLDGTYDLIEARLYVGDAGTPGVTGNRFEGSLRITGLTVERALVATNAGGTTRSFVRGTLTVAGTNGTYAITCPNPTQESLAISVLSSGASLTLSNQVTKEAFVWSKRP